MNSEQHTDGSHRIRDRLNTALEFAKRYQPLLMWILGIVMVLDAVFELNRLVVLAENPQLFVFVLGILTYLSGSISRDFQKENKKLERKLRRQEERADEYEELWREETLTE